MATSRTLYLIDASPLLFRAWFSMPSSLTAPDGRPINAVHGFVSALIRLAREEEPEAIVLAFDRSLNTSFRNDLYPEYKAARDLPPPELEEQCRLAEEVGAAFGAVCLSDERYEADDLIAGACSRWLAAGRTRRATVVSIDKDLCQLVTPRVELYDFPKGNRFDEDAVQEKFGVEPALLPDYQGLAGDPVDGIPGVKGVGPKSASFLVSSFGALEDVYADLERVAASGVRGAAGLAKRLEAGRELAFLSRDLARLAGEAVLEAGLVPEDLGAHRWKGVLREPFEALCEELGMRSTPGRVPRWA